jgi:hypothetical protein
MTTSATATRKPEPTLEVKTDTRRLKVAVTPRFVTALSLATVLGSSAYLANSATLTGWPKTVFIAAAYVAWVALVAAFGLRFERGVNA